MVSFVWANFSPGTLKVNYLEIDLRQSIPVFYVAAKQSLVLLSVQFLSAFLSLFVCLSLRVSKGAA